MVDEQLIPVGLRFWYGIRGTVRAEFVVSVKDKVDSMSWHWSSIDITLGSGEF
jgi:hypothetical protein